MKMHCRRLLWVGRERTQKTLRAFFAEFGPETTARLRFGITSFYGQNFILSPS